MLTDDELVIVLPVLRRPHRIEPVWTSARTATPGARIVFVASPDDRATLDALDALGHDYLTTTWAGGERGDYARKINLGYRSTTERLIFTGADDLSFHPGWYELAAAMIDVPEQVTTVLSGGATLVGPKTVPRIGVVGTKDICNDRTMRGEHSTHSLVARWYADQGGCAEQSAIIYHEGYFHEYCDDELVQTAMSRRAYAHSEAVVEHLHPNRNGNHPRPNELTVADDETYRIGRARSRLSRRVFMHRQQLWQGPAFRGMPR